MRYAHAAVEPSIRPAIPALRTREDVGVASDGSLWIPLYNVPTLLVVSSSGAVLHTIDLSSYDADGNPQAMGIAIVTTPAGEKAFVPLQRLNDQTFASEQLSWMLRVDVATAQVEATIALAGRNPFQMRAQADTGVIWLADPGTTTRPTSHWRDIERFDTSRNLDDGPRRARGRSRRERDRGRRRGRVWGRHRR